MAAINIINNMKGFQFQDVGLFTFYREQAEYEERLEIERKQKARKAKLKKQEQQRLRKLKLAEQQQSRPVRYICPSPSLNVPKQDYTQRAKKYIKQLQQKGHNKLALDAKKRQRRYANEQSEQQKKQVNISINNMVQEKSERKINLKESSDIFMSKKDFSKFNYYMLLDKSPVEPKEFNSVEVFDMGASNPNDLSKRQFSEDLLKRKILTKQDRQFGYSIKKLPKILPDVAPSARQSVSISKKQKTSPKMYYNPIDIILNNEKFKLKELIKTSKANHHDKQQKLAQMNNNQSIVSRQNSVMAVIKRYRMAK